MSKLGVTGEWQGVTMRAVTWTFQNSHRGLARTTHTPHTPRTQSIVLPLLARQIACHHGVSSLSCKWNMRATNMARLGTPISSRTLSRVLPSLARRIMSCFCFHVNAMYRPTRVGISSIDTAFIVIGKLGLSLLSIFHWTQNRYVCVFISSVYIFMFMRLYLLLLRCNTSMTTDWQWHSTWKLTVMAVVITELRTHVESQRFSILSPVGGVRKSTRDDVLLRTCSRRRAWFNRNSSSIDLIDLQPSCML